MGYTSTVFKPYCVFKRYSGFCAIEAGVARLVSKWDEKSLAAHKHDEQVDVTDRLLREFKLNEKQLKVVADLRHKKPLSLERAQELMRKGEL